MGEEEKGRTKEKGRAEKKGRSEEKDRTKEKSRAEKKGRTEEKNRSEEKSRTREKQQIKEKQDERECPVLSKCGGCRWGGRSYQEQLRVKATRFRKLMEPFCRTEAIIGMEQPQHYRCKVHAAFGEDRRHNPISGIYEEKSHRIVPIDSCLIENETADAIIVSIRGLLKSFKIRPYNEDTGYGLLRHVLIRVGHTTGQVLVVLVLASPILPSKNNFVKALVKLHPEITSVVINVNDRQTGMVLGNREHVIYGKGYIEDQLCGRIFRISPGSFYQVNPVQTEKLYGKAMEYAALTGKEKVLDAYCGTGTIGLIAGGSAGSVIGVELNADAVRDARSNAVRNGVKNIRFYQNDAGRFLRQMAEQGERPDVLFLDPPRSGSSPEFIEAALQTGPERIVYISCCPETLVRDLRLLTDGGYRVVRSAAVDMFPYTEEIETVCLLSKLNVKQHIEVELTMDEMDLTAAEKKASYEEIKAYVLEKFGMKVSHLYIAQVKRKCGIIERENYNKPKSEDSRQPQCPPEKEAAIRAALEHFRMIG